MPTTLVGRNAVAMYNKSGAAPDGIVYVDGIRGTLSLTSGGLGILPANLVKVDYVPTGGTISVGIALAAAIDSGFNPFKPVSGNIWGLEYIRPTVSAGQFGQIIREGWTVT
jgi:hypothetical protein